MGDLQCRARSRARRRVVRRWSPALSDTPPSLPSHKDFLLPRARCDTVSSWKPRMAKVEVTGPPWLRARSWPLSTNFAGVKSSGADAVASMIGVRICGRGTVVADVVARLCAVVAEAILPSLCRQFFSLLKKPCLHRLVHPPRAPKGSCGAAGR